MRIGIVAQNFFTPHPTGVERYTQNIVLALDKLVDAQDTIIVYTRTLPQNAPQFHRTSFCTIGSKKFFNLWRVKRYARRDNLDALFCPAGSVPVGAKNFRTVTTIHGMEFYQYPQGYSLKKRIVLWVSTWLGAAFADVILVPTQATKDALIKYFPAAQKKIVIVPHGAPPVKNFPKTHKNINHLLYIGNIELRKNITTLNSALAMVSKDFPLVQCDLVGMWSANVQLSPLDLSKNITWRGFVPEEKKEEILENSAILILPSFAEGFGLPILEAQAHGCAVACSDIPVLREVAGGGALFFNPKNPYDITQKISILLRDENARKVLIAEGYKNITRFSWEDSAKKTLGALQG